MNSRSRRLAAFSDFARGSVFTIALFSLVRFAEASPISVDLGPSHTITSQTPPSPFDALNGMTLDGQSVSLDFSFLNGEFVRIFSITSPNFQASIKLQTNKLGFAGFLDGTGYVIDIDGNEIPGYGITGSASGSDGSLAISLFPLLKDEDGTPNDDLLRPFDFYGVHYDLIFPDLDDSSIFITGGKFRLSSDGGVFGIGPGVPRNIVPDSGSTLVFMGLALALAVGLRS
jgi:hypothetical protein